MYSNTLTTLKREIIKHSKDNRILLCIGTKNCIGDSLGPLVGEILKKQLREKNIQVLGNMKESISYNNINNTLEMINNKYKNPYIIAVDSALSKKEYIGSIVTIKENIVLGSALGKCRYKIGNIGIKGIVGEKRETLRENLISLRTVPKETIMSLAFKISEQIYYSIIE